METLPNHVLKAWFSGRKALYVLDAACLIKKALQQVVQEPFI